MGSNPTGSANKMLVRWAISLVDLSKTLQITYESGTPGIRDVFQRPKHSECRSNGRSAGDTKYAPTMSHRDPDEAMWQQRVWHRLQLIEALDNHLGGRYWDLAQAGSELAFDDSLTDPFQTSRTIGHYLSFGLDCLRNLFVQARIYPSALRQGARKVDLAWGTASFTQAGAVSTSTGDQEAPTKVPEY